MSVQKTLCGLSVQDADSRPRTVRCRLCGQCFATREGLAGHERMKHPGMRADPGGLIDAMLLQPTASGNFVAEAEEDAVGPEIVTTKLPVKKVTLLRVPPAVQRTRMRMVLMMYNMLRGPTFVIGCSI